MRQAGLYIHIPFCKRKCLYCDFVSYASTNLIDMERYVSALEREIVMLAERFSHIKIATVFIGGGTPSILPAGLVSRILNRVKGSFTVLSGAEITIEANPNTLTPSKLEEFDSVGVNRLSIGVQNANDAILKRIGRIHTFLEAAKTVEVARDFGFDNINLDIMYGLPGQTGVDYRDTLEKIISLNPQHISAYSLILEEETPLYDMLKTSGSFPYSLPDEDEEYQMHRDTIKLLTKSGYARYEVSNYSKSGYECRHNLNYWENGEYIGAGVAAHSAYRDGDLWRRCSNLSDVQEYIAVVAHTSLPTAQDTIVSKREEMFETMMVGLRKTEGVWDDVFKFRFGVSMFDFYRNSIKALVNEHNLIAEKDRIYMTEHGMDLLNYALQFFLDESAFLS